MVSHGPSSSSDEPGSPGRICSFALPWSVVVMSVAGTVKPASFHRLTRNLWPENRIRGEGDNGRSEIANMELYCRA